MLDNKMLLAQLYKKGLIFLPNESILLNLGSYYFNIKDLANAQKYWEELLGLNSKSSLAYSSLALVYFIKGEREKAIEYVNTALSFDSTNSDALRLKNVLNNGQSIAH